jgi:hypothetical protein
MISQLMTAPPFRPELDQSLERGRHGRPELVMPAFRTDRVGARPLAALVLDHVCEPEHCGDAGKCRWQCRGQPPICRVYDAARVATALPRLIHNSGAVLMVTLNFVLCIDCLAMGDISRQLFGYQSEGRIDRGRSRQHSG